MDEQDVGMIDFDPGSAMEQDAQDSVGRFVVPLNNRAVLPDGRQVTRAEILTQLGLNPGTRPDAWLAIIGCGSNASALNLGEARELAIRNAVRASELVGRLNRMNVGGLVSGGSAPGG